MASEAFEELRTVGGIKKSNRATIQARIVRAYGRRAADFRVFVAGGEGQDVATPHGFTVPLDGRLLAFAELVLATAKIEGIHPEAPDDAAPKEDAAAALDQE